jgi:hypothetical protein
MRVKVGLTMRARRRIGLFQPEPPQADATVRIERRDQIAEIGLMEFRDDGRSNGASPV